MPRHPPNALLTLESNYPCAGTSPHSQTLSRYSRKIITLPAPLINRNMVINQNRDIGSSRQLAAANPCARGQPQNRRKLSKTYSQFQRSHPPAEGFSGNSYTRDRKAKDRRALPHVTKVVVEVIGIEPPASGRRLFEVGSIHPITT